MLRPKGHGVLVRQGLQFEDLAPLPLDPPDGLKASFQHLKASFRQFDRLAGPVDQVHPHPGLKALDAPTESRLAQVALRGGLRKVARLLQARQIAKQIHVHAGMHNANYA